jgi:hypothetical protein
MKKQQEESDRAMKELLEEEQSKAAAVKKKKEDKSEKDRRKKFAEEEERKKKEDEEKEKEKLQVQNRKNTAATLPVQPPSPDDDDDDEEEEDGAIKFQARLASSAGQGEGCAADDEPYDEEQAFQRALKASMEDVDQDEYGGRPSDHDVFLAKDRQNQRMVFEEPPKPIPSGDYQAPETGTCGGVVDVRVNKTPSKAPRGGAGGGAVGGGFGGGGRLLELAWRRLT